jgi:hypothetical protein
MNRQNHDEVEVKEEKEDENAKTKNEKKKDMKYTNKQMSLLNFGFHNGVNSWIYLSSYCLLKRGSELCGYCISQTV